jgi:hypothetical protein
VTARPASRWIGNRDLFTDLVAKTAAELGMYVKEPDPDEGVYDHTGAEIISATGDGTGYRLSSPCWEHSGREVGRTSIHPIWPATHYYYAPGDQPSCSCDCDRGPHAIAADIARKLAPVYRATLAKIAVFDATVAAEQAARDALTAQISDLVGGRYHAAGHAQSWHSTSLQLHGPGYAGITVEFDGDGTEMRIGGSYGMRVPADVGLEVLEVWAGWAVPAQAAEDDEREAERVEALEARATRPGRPDPARPVSAGHPLDAAGLGLDGPAARAVETVRARLFRQE